MSFFLLMPFIYDPVLVIYKRLAKGENIFKPHNNHQYQRLINLNYTHEKVLKICEITYFLCGLPAILYAIADNGIIKLVQIIFQSV